MRRTLNKYRISLKWWSEVINHLAYLFMLWACTTHLGNEAIHTQSGKLQLMLPTHLLVKTLANTRGNGVSLSPLRFVRSSQHLLHMYWEMKELTSLCPLLLVCFVHTPRLSPLLVCLFWVHGHLLERDILTYIYMEMKQLTGQVYALRSLFAYVMSSHDLLVKTYNTGGMKSMTWQVACLFALSSWPPS